MGFLLWLNSGAVEEIGGLKSKIQAAFDGGCDTFVIPAAHCAGSEVGNVIERVGKSYEEKIETPLFTKKLRDSVRVFGVGDVYEAIELCLIPEHDKGNGSKISFF